MQVGETLIVGRSRPGRSSRQLVPAVLLVLAGLALLGAVGVVHLMGYSPLVTVTGAPPDGGALYPVACAGCPAPVSSTMRVLLVWGLSLVVGSFAAVIVRLGRSARDVNAERSTPD